MFVCVGGSGDVCVKRRGGGNDGERTMGRNEGGESFGTHGETPFVLMQASRRGLSRPRRYAHASEQERAKQASQICSCTHTHAQCTKLETFLD